MTVLYPNLCYNNVCYKGTALYILFSDSEVPELLPIGYLVGDTMQIGLCLKGMCKPLMTACTAPLANSVGLDQMPHNDPLMTAYTTPLANSVSLDQMPHDVASDQSLHCLH